MSNAQSFSIKQSYTWPPIAGQDCPLDTGFIPALIRRRCSQLTKMALCAADQALQQQHASYFVFASQHGELACAVSLLQSLSEQELLSPAKFVGSVHNTSCGLFSIIHKLRQNMTSIAAGENTFIMAMIDALAWLKQHPEDQVLVTVFDDYIPQAYQSLNIDSHQYAAAFLLSNTGENTLVLNVKPTQTSPTGSGPQALQFAQWLHQPKNTPLQQGNNHFALLWQKRPA